MKLSEQIAAYPNGGTVDLKGHPLPKDGYFIAHKDSQNTHNPVDALAIAAANELRYFGWWKDSETGKTYYDAVMYAGNIDSAKAYGLWNDQIAVWDIANSKEIRL